MEEDSAINFEIKRCVMSKKELPTFGVGPVYVITCLIATLAGLILNKTGYLKGGNIDFPNYIMITIGSSLVVIGITLWIYAVIIQKITKEIKKGELVTTGVYSIVRNPIYSAFLLVFTGVLITAHNLYLLILPILYYLFLTILMRKTE